MYIGYVTVPQIGHVIGHQVGLVMGRYCLVIRLQLFSKIIQVKKIKFELTVMKGIFECVQPKSWPSFWGPEQSFLVHWLVFNQNFVQCADL